MTKMKNEKYKPNKSTIENAILSEAEYLKLYEQSLKDPDTFWAERAKRLHWIKEPKIIKNTTFEKDVSIKWYEDGILNACYNCVDRHLPEKENTIALIWEGNDPNHHQKITYKQLKYEVCKLSNALIERGITKGDRVTIYMPMIPQAIYAILACARIGAVHSVVFGGFSPESLRNRILDCESNVIITADAGRRGDKIVPLKFNTDTALKECPNVHTVLVYNLTNTHVEWDNKRDIWWHEIVEKQLSDCPCTPMNAEDPLFLLYTSGSTGKPKGVLHTTGGYLVYVSLTHEWVFDYKPGEIYWCTADIGWITGHSYIVYGPLANGATTLIFEGIPNYPDSSRFWQIVDKHNVNIFYTAPTAIRSLIRAGDEFVKKTKRVSLRILATVGEPINHEAWLWYRDTVGDSRCPVIDTWWQTETGGHMITALPVFQLKPGCASKPFFGIEPIIVDTNGNILQGESEGALCIKDSWPGQMRTVFGDHERFINTYFNTYKGMYFTGDGAKRDIDGDYWITGRIDDVLNVSGHRMGTAEIESAIDEHPKVAESAVVGYPHDIKGQGIFAYVLLLAGTYDSEDKIRKEIIQTVREIIGPIATPDIILIANGLPKTRSGKIMRRLLRKIAAKEFDELGDTSTLADPTVVIDLIEQRKKI